MSTVIVTGSARGIGAAVVSAFAAENNNVVINYKSSEKEAIELLDKLKKNGACAIAVQADVSVREDVERLFSEAEKNFGFVDVLVNNAGIAQQKLFTDITDDDYDRMFNCNVRSAFYCSQRALPQMIHHKYGRIINITSMWGISGASCEVHYSASKSAIVGMTKALAKEVAPSGITVNAIAPGVIDTPMNSGFDSETMDELKNETPVGRIGTPEDVAGAVMLFADKGSGFITGQILGVDGGFI